MTEDRRLRDIVAEVAASYFSNSHVPPAEIPNVVRQIAESLRNVDEQHVTNVQDASASPQPDSKKVSAAQIRKSITPAALISFEDGRPYKTLRRHLATRGLSPVQYREKWGLPVDYPMVAPEYSAARSQMAKNIGLGQLRAKAQEPAKVAPRGRRKKAADSTKA